MTTTIALSIAMLFHPPATTATHYQTSDFKLTSEVKSETMTNLLKAMNEVYVLPIVAKKIEVRLRDWMSTPEFEQTTDPRVFAKLVNDSMRLEATDAHLRLRYSDRVLAKRANPREPSPEEIKRYREEVRFANAGFDKIERLPGNIGYLSFLYFAPPEDMAQPLEGAIRFLANVDAMIVDLRQNGGGDPAGVRLFCSYFFDSKPVHLNDIVFRKGDKTTTTEFWTLKKVAGPRLPQVPLYILTDKRTGSGAEECAYNFQQLKRGKLIGESTWGGANPGGNVRLSDHFECFIPVGMARNPYTKTNWEGTGVIPDVRCTSNEALKKAHVLSLEEIVANTKDEERKRDLMRVLEEVVKGN